MTDDFLLLKILTKVYSIRAIGLSSANSNSLTIDEELESKIDNMEYEGIPM